MNGDTFITNNKVRRFISFLIGLFLLPYLKKDRDVNAFAVGYDHQPALPELFYDAFIKSITPNEMKTLKVPIAEPF